MLCTLEESRDKLKKSRDQLDSLAARLASLLRTRDKTQSASGSIAEDFIALLTAVAVGSGALTPPSPLPPPPPAPPRPPPRALSQVTSR